MYKTLGLVRISVLISAITKSFWVFFSAKLFYKSNSKLFYCVCISWYKHSRDWENSRQLCKSSTSSRVCVTVSNSPNCSRVYWSGYANTENIFYCLNNHKSCRLVELLIIKFVSTWIPSQATDNSKKPLSQGFSHLKEKKAGETLSSIPHSRNLYKGDEVKFSAQWFLGSLERTSVMLWLADGIQGNH